MDMDNFCGDGYESRFMLRNFTPIPKFLKLIYF